MLVASPVLEGDATATRAERMLARWPDEPAARALGYASVFDSGAGIAGRDRAIGFTVAAASAALFLSGCFPSDTRLEF